MSFPQHSLQKPSFLADYSKEGSSFAAFHSDFQGRFGRSVLR
jgi:hypothetical protein